MAFFTHKAEVYGKATYDKCKENGESEAEAKRQEAKATKWAKDHGAK
jgi:hypothetical protein